MSAFEIKGKEVILNNLRKVTKGLGKGIEEGLSEAGKYLLEESNEVVPLLTAQLRDDAMTVDDLKGLETIVYVVYGPVSSPSYQYAVIQHENLEFNHAPGKQAKYLEGTMRKTTVRNKIREIIAEKTETEVKKVRLIHVR